MMICRFCGEAETAPGVCALCGGGQSGSLLQPIAGSAVTGCPEPGELENAALADAGVAGRAVLEAGAAAGDLADAEPAGEAVPYAEAAAADIGPAGAAIPEGAAAESGPRTAGRARGRRKTARMKRPKIFGACSARVSSGQIA